MDAGTDDQNGETIGWQHTQNSEYTSLVRNRLENTDLSWVAQFIDIIEAELETDQISIKDIGCQAFQFYKQIKRHGLLYDYTGYELDEEYVRIGLEYFPEMEGRYHLGDFTKITDVAPTDVSICSATLEHVDDWKILLRRLFGSTRKLVVIRTLLGETTQRTSVKKVGALLSYPIWQFGFDEILNEIDKNDWLPELRRDRYTDSLPIYKSYGTEKLGVVRTQFVIVAKPQ